MTDELTAEMLQVLKELTTQARYMDNMQHAGLELYPMDWSRINELCNKSFAVIEKATT